jgi:hypothetical protein
MATKRRGGSAQTTQKRLASHQGTRPRSTVSDGKLTSSGITRGSDEVEKGRDGGKPLFEATPVRVIKGPDDTRIYVRYGVGGRLVWAGVRDKSGTLYTIQSSLRKLKGKDALPDRLQVTTRFLIAGLLLLKTSSLIGLRDRYLLTTLTAFAHGKRGNSLAILLRLRDDGILVAARVKLGRKHKKGQVLVDFATRKYPQSLGDLVKGTTINTLFAPELQSIAAFNPLLTRLCVRNDVAMQKLLVQSGSSFDYHSGWRYLLSRSDEIAPGRSQRRGHARLEPGDEI